MIGKVSAGLAYALSASRDVASTSMQYSPFKLKQDYSAIEQLAADLAAIAKDINIGAMMELTQNPNDTTTECYLAAVETGDYLIAMTDLSQYISGSFDPATFTDLFKQMQIKLAVQYEDCKFMNVLISMDSVLSDITRTVPVYANTAMQAYLNVVEGQQTPMTIGADKISQGYSSGDWQGVGGGLMLIVSRALTISSSVSGTEQDVKPTNYDN